VIDFDNMTLGQLRLFNELKQEVLSDYNSISSELQSLGKEDICWLTSNLASRNVNFSQILYYLNCILFLECCKKQNISFEKIITKDKVLYKTLKDYYPTEFIKGKSANKSDAFLKLKVFVSYLLWCFNAFRSRSKERKDKLKGVSNLTFVDAYIAKKTNKYQDRYYGSVVNKLSFDDRKRVYFLIQYLPIPNKNDIKEICKNSDENIVFLFDFLKAQDYIASLFSKLRSYFKFRSNFYYKGISLKYILKDAFDKQDINYYFSCGILWERFFYRLKVEDIKLRTFVDWFENQSCDKACYYSAYKYFPSVKMHGFIGFIGDFKIFPHNLATNEELRLHIAPSHLFLCNKAMRDEYLYSGYEGKLSLAPTFRADKIWETKRNFDNNGVFTILVPLSLVHYEVEFKIDFFKNYVDKYRPNDCEVIIKPHPVYPMNQLMELIGDSKHIKVETGDIYEYLKLSDVVVGSNSTTLYESLALGIPILSLCDMKGKLKVNKPNSVKDEMWYEITDIEDISGAVSKIKILDRNMLVNESIRLKDYFFERITERSTKKLFGLNTD